MGGQVMTDATADWCAVECDIAICGTDMVEYNRHPMGIKWCFTCRTRNEFNWIVMVPSGPSYYGPTAHSECSGCKSQDSDLFPGWYRPVLDL